MTRRKPPHDLRAGDVPPQAKTAEVEIVDPYGDRGVALVSVRDDYLAWLWARGDIAEHQYQAGRRWQRYYEVAQSSGSRGIDPTRERVDGGAMADPLGESHLRALDALADSRRLLGLADYELVEDICGRGLSLWRAAVRRLIMTRRGRDYLGRRFRDALDLLAEHWGMRTPAR